MLSRIKQYIVYAMIAGVLYFFLSQHIVFYNKNFYLLPKEELTLEYTFFSIQEKSPDKILEVTPLRHAGIGELLVDLEIITDDERYELEEYWEFEAQYE